MSPLLFLTLVLALGVCAQWIAWRFKLPSILLLLAFGFALGHFTGTRIDDFLAPGDGHSSPLLSLVGLFVAIILFEGGLTLRIHDLRESGAPIAKLCTVAVALSFALSTGFLTWVLGYDWRIGAVIGAILTVTGPTVIAPLLRHVNPTRKIASILKWEGIVVDPIGAILAVLLFKVALATDIQLAGESLLRSFGMMLAVGVAGAFVLAKLVEWLLKHHLIPDFLQPVFLLAVVAVAFTASNMLEREAGLLTVTVLGIALANQRSVSVRHILEFKENLRVLIISSLFIVLSGRISPAELGAVLSKGLLLLAFLIVLGRPISVLVALLGSKRSTVRERLFLAFLAPRGIVAAAITAVFALEFELAAAEHRFQAGLNEVIARQSGDLVALVFLVIIGTVTFYGLLATPLARRLGLASRNPTGILFAGADEWVRLVAQALHDDGHQVMLLDTNYKNIATARLAGLEAHRANILSEFAEEELDFNGLGHLVAGTPNDEVNSLAADQFIHYFGRAGVWQITPADSEAHHSTAVADHMRGRLCFTGKPRHSQLRQLARAGATVKKTQLSDVFTLDDFRITHGNQEPVILFLQDPTRGLRPAPTELDKLPPGTSLYVLMPPKDPENETDGSSHLRSLS